MGLPKYRVFTFELALPDGAELISFRERRLADAERALQKAIEVRGYAKNTESKRILRKGERK